MLIAALLLPIGPRVSAVEPGAYTYAIDIEFGNLSFYYDYGMWNVNTMRYEAADTSREPADGTANGYPGWYGFDSIANRIAVKNSGSGGKAVTVSLTYRPLAAAELMEAGVPAVVEGVSMTVSGWGGNNWTVVPADSSVEGFVHLQGEPRVAGQRYDSVSMAPIGMFTLTITDWE